VGSRCRPRSQTYERTEMIYRIYNHNHTLLGEFKTQKEANDEAMLYMRETGNPAYVMKEKK